jgi:hypothetical protein
MDEVCENNNANSQELDTENDVQKEESPVPVSKFEYIKIVKQTTSTVVLEWKYNDEVAEKVEDFDNEGSADGEITEEVEEPAEKVFKIVKLKNRNEWETICWTRKSLCVIKNLEQNTCYSIKILVMVQTTEKFEAIDSSDVFKVNIIKVLYIHV